MSRLGKKAILVPENVEVKKEGNNLCVKGPLGDLKKVFKDDIEIILKEGTITLNPKKTTKETMALWGTYASHIKNMLQGVTKGFKKNLVIEGIGYKAQINEEKLVLNLGLSHPVKLDIPDGIKVKVEKNIIDIFGANKEKVGQFSAEIRSMKKPEPYKGKGIRYEDEIIKRKAGKKAVAAG